MLRPLIKGNIEWGKMYIKPNLYGKVFQKDVINFSLGKGRKEEIRVREESKRRWVGVKG